MLVFYSLLFLLGSPAAHSQFVHTQGTEIVDASGAPLQIRGISIGNWFVLEGYFWGFGGLSQSQTDVEMVFTDLLGPTHAQEFLYNWRQNFLSKADVDRIKEDGFNTIRIPLHSKYFKTDDDEGFKLIDQLSKWCREDHTGTTQLTAYMVGDLTYPGFKPLPSFVVKDEAHLPTHPPEDASPFTNPGASGHWAHI